MSSIPDHYFVQTLDAFSKKFLDNPADKTQISGWSEDFNDSDARKRLLSAGCLRIKKFLVETDLFYNSVQFSRQLKKTQFINKTLSLGPNNSKLAPKGNPKLLNKRVNSKEPKNSLKISAPPLLKFREETIKDNLLRREEKVLNL